MQEAARAARYRLLGEAARKAGAPHILTAHTLDDQAETVLIRMARGSGLTGLAAMHDDTAAGHVRRGAGAESGDAIVLVRPLLDIAEGAADRDPRGREIPFADDPSNRDPRFTRARLRGLMGALAAEGLDAPPAGAARAPAEAGRCRRSRRRSAAAWPD